MMEVARYHGKIHEIAIRSQDHFQGLIEITKTDNDIIPLFVRNEDKIDIIQSSALDLEIQEGSVLAYLGKEIVEKDTGEVVMEEKQS